MGYNILPFNKVINDSMYLGIVMVLELRGSDPKPINVFCVMVT